MHELHGPVDVTSATAITETTVSVYAKPLLIIQYTQTLQRWYSHIRYIHQTQAVDAVLQSFNSSVREKNKTKWLDISN